MNIGYLIWRLKNELAYLAYTDETNETIIKKIYRLIHHIITWRDRKETTKMLESLNTPSIYRNGLSDKELRIKIKKIQQECSNLPNCKCYLED